VNELEVGTVVLRSRGDLDTTLAHDAFLLTQSGHWFVREVLLFWARVLRRLDMTARTIITLIEPGSCFGGLLAELALAADRSYMLIGAFAGEGGHEARLALTEANLIGYPMSNGLSRLETRFWGDPEGHAGAREAIGSRLGAEESLAAGLITDAMDDLDWEDELRIVFEERAAFSPDGLTGLEANLRFPGPETMETKIFGRLTAWQNWVFQRPNASGEAGALRRYGTGIRPEYDHRRV
jgi:benzoyl-CoA-dihydrodiol lyase